MSTETMAYTNLTTGTSVETGCGEQYVVAGDPASSLLYQKVLGGSSLPAACGDRMPDDEAALKASDVTLIQEWIQGGAHP
jgi:hypothetical protein